jgi:hypothetical protein
VLYFPDVPATRAGLAPIHGAAPIRWYGWTAGIGMCGVAGPRETILDVPQQVAGEMRRPAHRSSHVHNMPAEGNGTITGSNRLFLSS